MDGEPAVATALGIASKTVRKWRDRFAAEGAAGFADRSSRPHRSPRQVAEPIQAEIARLRRERLSGPAIARQTHVPPATVGLVLRRLGLGRLAALDPNRLRARQGNRPLHRRRTSTRRSGLIGTWRADHARICAKVRNHDVAVNRRHGGSSRPARS
jgi:hypothetical protein